MHIGLIIYNDLHTVSGGYLYDRMLVEYLRRRGDSVEVLSLPQKGYCRQLLDNFSLPLKEKVVSLKLDVLLQDELVYPSLSFLNRGLRRMIACPVISIVHHLRSSEPRCWGRALGSDMERRYLRSVDGFVFVSKHTARAAGSLVPLRVPSVIAYPGKDRFPCCGSIQPVRERVSNLGKFNILYVGNVIPRKALHVLIDALALLGKGPWHLNVAGNLLGDRAYTHFLFKKIIKAGLVKQVSFLGPVQDADLVDWYRQSHLLAVPSFHEGFGIVYLEALGFGVPVIAASSGGAAEIIVHGREGYLLEAGNVRALAGYIARLNEDRRLLLDMSLKAFERHKEFPTWHQTMATVRGFLEGFAGKRSIGLPEYEYGFSSRRQRQEVMAH